MEFKFNANAEVAKKIGGTGVDTGIHKAKITETYVTKTKNENNILDVFFETTDGGKFGVYGMCIDEKWSSGSENFDYPVFMELALSAGMKTGETYDKVKTIGNDKVDAKGLKELEGKIVNVAVIFEIDVEDNKEKRTRKIQRVFNEAGLSIAEVEAGKTTGTAMKKLDDRLADYETKRYKTWKAGGGTPIQEPVDTPNENASSPAEEEDLI